MKSEIYGAVVQLAQSERGLRTLTHLRAMLADGLSGLDAYNRAALQRLLDACYTHPTTLEDVLSSVSCD